MIDKSRLTEDFTALPGEGLTDPEMTASAPLADAPDLAATSWMTASEPAAGGRTPIVGLETEPGLDTSGKADPEAPAGADGTVGLRADEDASDGDARAGAQSGPGGIVQPQQPPQHPGHGDGGGDGDGEEGDDGPPTPPGPPTHSIDEDNIGELLEQIHGNRTPWSKTTLKYAFPQSTGDLPEAHSDYADPEAAGLDAVVGFDTARQEAAISAMNHWAELTGLTFQEAGPGEAADIYFFGRAYPPDTPFSAFSTGVNETDGSLIVFDTNEDAWNEMELGRDRYRTLLHEIGHSIALGHPGDYDAGDGATYESHAEYIQDSRQYTP